MNGRLAVKPAIALHLCMQQFESYAEHHRSKVKSNEAYAKLCRDTLLNEGWTDNMTTNTVMAPNFRGTEMASGFEQGDLVQLTEEGQRLYGITPLIYRVVRLYGDYVWAQANSETPVTLSAQYLKLYRKF